METEGLGRRHGKLEFQDGVKINGEDLLIGAGWNVIIHEDMEPPSGSCALFKPSSSSFVLSHMPDLPDLPVNTPNSNINVDIRKNLFWHSISAAAFRQIRTGPAQCTSSASEKDIRIYAVKLCESVRTASYMAQQEKWTRMVTSFLHHKVDGPI